VFAASMITQREIACTLATLPAALASRGGDPALVLLGEVLPRCRRGDRQPGVERPLRRRPPTGRLKHSGTFIQRDVHSRMTTTATETVLSVHHWNDTLFSFKTTRNPGLRFENGHFVMIGLEVEGRPLMRAYSIASPNLRGTPGVLQHQGARWTAHPVACSTCARATPSW